MTGTRCPWRVHALLAAGVAVGLCVAVVNCEAFRSGQPVASSAALSGQLLWLVVPLGMFSVAVVTSAVLFVEPQVCIVWEVAVHGR